MPRQSNQAYTIFRYNRDLYITGNPLLQAFDILTEYTIHFLSGIDEGITSLPLISQLTE